MTQGLELSPRVALAMNSWKSKLHGSSLRAEGDRLVETDESIEEARALSEQSLPGQRFKVLDLHPAGQRDVRVATALMSSHPGRRP